MTYFLDVLGLLNFWGSLFYILAPTYFVSLCSCHYFTQFLATRHLGFILSSPVLAPSHIVFWHYLTQCLAPYLSVFCTISLNIQRHFTQFLALLHAAVLVVVFIIIGYYYYNSSYAIIKFLVFVSSVPLIQMVQFELTI